MHQKPQTFAVLADDLTGAMDGGLQLLAHGIRIQVLFGTNEARPFRGATVIDTESRNASLDEARSKIRLGTAIASGAGLPIRYKKIDSTLRGNIGIELEEFLASSPSRAVLLAPAIPGAGRTIVDGHHYLNGTAIDNTEMAFDPKMPILTSNISALIGHQTALPCGSLLLRDIRSGIRRASGVCAQMLNSGVRIIICDSGTEEDLQTVAALAVEIGDRAIPCGSAGLLKHIAPMWFVGESAAVHPDTRELFADNHAGSAVLIVSASMSEATKTQIRRARDDLGDLEVISPDRDALFDNATNSEETERIRKTAERLLASGHHVIIDLAGSDRGDLKERESELILRAVSYLVVSACSEGRLDCLAGLLLTGGETAAAVLQSAGSAGIEIIGEVEPLIPSGIIFGGKLDQLRVVTKAGGFGSERALVRACRYLAR